MGGRLERGEADAVPERPVEAGFAAAIPRKKMRKAFGSWRPEREDTQ